MAFDAVAHVILAEILYTHSAVPTGHSLIYQCCWLHILKSKGSAILLIWVLVSSALFWCFVLSPSCLLSLSFFFTYFFHCFFFRPHLQLKGLFPLTMVYVLSGDSKIVLESRKCKKQQHPDLKKKYPITIASVSNKPFNWSIT